MGRSYIKDADVGKPICSGEIGRRANQAQFEKTRSNGDQGPEHYFQASFGALRDKATVMRSRPLALDS
jgi:hypothetical protein